MPSQLSLTPALAELEAAIKSDSDVFKYYARPWVKARLGPDNEPILDVAIIGAGQNGLGCAYALRCEGVTRVQAFDESAPGRNGNFAKYTHMNFLRTPKDLCGLERGDPRLSFQRYYEARFGAEAWEPLTHSPRAAFADYLHWYAELLELPVAYERKLERIEPLPGDIFRLHFKTPQGPSQTLTRLIVLAGGPGADQRPNVPSEISIRAKSSRWAHGSDNIDFSKLEGKQVAVLGHGAGAFDIAGCALEAGAKVDLFYRRKKIPLVNPRRHLENAGMMPGFKFLPPEDRWRIIKRLIDIDQPPPQRAFERIYQKPGLSVHPGVQWKTLEDTETGIRIETTEQAIEADFAILATGFRSAPLKRPDIADFADKIRTWESFTPPEGLEDAGISSFPDLGPGFEFQPKADGQDEWLRQIFNVSFGSGMNHGSHIVSVSGMQFSIPRLSAGVRDRLFLLDADHYVAEALAFEEPELQIPTDQVERFNAPD